MISINLLDNRRKEVLERQAASVKILMVSLVVSLVSLSTAGIIYAVNFYYSNLLSQTESELASIERDLDSYSDVYLRLGQLQEQLTSVDQILNTRLYAEIKLDLFVQLVQSGLMQIRSVGFGGALNPMEFEVVGSVSNTKEFVTLHSYMRNLAETQNFNTLTLAAFSVAGDGQYSFRYVVRLNTIGGS